MVFKLLQCNSFILLAKCKSLFFMELCIACTIHVPVFHIRDGSRVKNPTATTTWPNTDENDNRLRYSYKLKYYTLCDPPEKMHVSLPKKLTGTLMYNSFLQFLQKITHFPSDECCYPWYHKFFICVSGDFPACALSYIFCNTILTFSMF